MHLRVIGTVSRSSREHVDLALVLRVEEVADRVHVRRELGVDDQARHPALPRHGELPIRVGGGMAEGRDQVLLDVRQLRVVELLDVAGVVHLLREPVAHRDQVAASRLAIRELRLELAEELVVVVDVLDVVDLDACLVLELGDRPVLARVDVERPLRDRELALHGAGCVHLFGADLRCRIRSRPSRRIRPRERPAAAPPGPQWLRASAAIRSGALPLRLSFSDHSLNVIRTIPFQRGSARLGVSRLRDRIGFDCECGEGTRLRGGSSSRARRGRCSWSGAVGLRVKDVAERAGLAPSSVLYYYPSLDELLIEVSRGAIERFTERRAAAAVRRLAAARTSCGSRSIWEFPPGPTTSTAGCSMSSTRSPARAPRSGS